MKAMNPFKAVPEAVKRLLSPPTFADPEKTRIAGMLNTVLWGLLFVAGIIALADPAIGRPLSLVMSVGIVLLQIALHKGYVQMSGLLLTMLLFASTTAGVYLDGTIRTSATGAYFLVIVIAGLFAGKLGLITFTILSTTALLALYYFEYLGKLAPITFTTLGTDSFGTWVVYAMAMLMLATLLFLALTSIEMAFARARQSAEELRMSNRDLLELQRSLEEKIKEGTQAAEAARKRAEAAQEKLGEQVWQVTGLAQLSDVMRGEQDMQKLAQAVLEHVANYVEAEAGALYLLQDNTLSLSAAYAFRPPEGRDERRTPDGGLMGQVIADRQPRHLTNTERSLKVISAFGEIDLAHVALYPLLCDHLAVGVLELGGLAPFTEAQSHFWYVSRSLSQLVLEFREENVCFGGWNQRKLEISQGLAHVK